MVAADVLLAQPPDLCIHDRAGLLEALAQPDRVALRQKAAQELLAELLDLRQVPRREAHDLVLRQALRRIDQHVVEEVPDFAGHVGPARARDLASPGDVLPVAVPLGVGLRLGVVVAALSRVLGAGHGVKRPEGGVDAGKLAEVGEAVKAARGEPAGGDPAVEGVAGLAFGDGERQERPRRNHGLGRLGTVFQVDAAVGALVGRDLVLQQDHRPATGALHLRGALRQGSFFAGVVAPVRLPVPHLDRGRRGFDRLLEAAVGTLKRAAGRVEVEARAAFLTWKLAARGRRAAQDGRPGRRRGWHTGPRKCGD